MFLVGVSCGFLHLGHFVHFRKHLALVQVFGGQQSSFQSWLSLDGAVKRAPRPSPIRLREVSAFVCGKQTRLPSGFP